MSAIVGTLSFLVTNGEDQQNIASLTSCRLQFQTEMLPALNPESYGAEYFIPGNQDWRGESTALQLVDATTGEREEYLQLLEQYFFNKTLLDLEFVNPAGVSYEGQGYIDTFQLGAGESEGYSGTFGVQGVTSLAIT